MCRVRVITTLSPGGGGGGGVIICFLRGSNSWLNYSEGVIFCDLISRGVLA